jgi:ATP-dependent Lon protease
MGKVLPVGGVQEKIRAAVEAGAKEVLIPKDNMTEADAMPPQIRQKLIVTPVQTVSEVLAAALLPLPSHD